MAAVLLLVKLYDVADKMGYFTQTTGHPVAVEMPEWLLPSAAFFYLSPGYPRVAQYDYP
jgi:hypothetical protein